jgi:hypothetical protein
MRDCVSADRNLGVGDAAIDDALSSACNLGSHLYARV